jgi:hypothetical protein
MFQAGAIDRDQQFEEFGIFSGNGKLRADIFVWMLQEDMNQSLSHVYNVPTMLDALAQIAYQQILANTRTLRPGLYVECVLAHISDLYYGRR